MEKSGERPNVRLTNADLSLNLHIAATTCTLSLDSSGESLHKRGYRVSQTEAPINEVLAAGLILKTGWDGSKNLIDPMCGSGTFLIEAALIATNTPPGVFRQNFAFEKWNDYDVDLFDSLYNDESGEKEFDCRIYGSDVSPRAIDIASENIKSAGMSKYINLKVKSFQSYTTETTPKDCMLIMNPPYGERISSKDLLSLYELIGTTLKHQFKGYDAWILSYREECFESIGLRPSVKFDVMNGALDCGFRKYEIFEGGMKDFKSEGGRFSSDEKNIEINEMGGNLKEKFRKERRIDGKDGGRDRRSSSRGRDGFSKDRNSGSRDKAPFSRERRGSFGDKEGFSKDRDSRSGERRFSSDRPERRDGERGGFSKDRDSRSGERRFSSDRPERRDGERGGFSKDRD